MWYWVQVEIRKSLNDRTLWFRVSHKLSGLAGWEIDMHDQQRERNPIEIWRVYFLREAASAYPPGVLNVLKGHYRMILIVYRNTLSFFFFPPTRGYLQKYRSGKEKSWPNGSDAGDLLSSYVIFLCSIVICGTSPMWGGGLIFSEGARERAGKYISLCNPFLPPASTPVREEENLHGRDGASRRRNRREIPALAQEFLFSPFV